jgi:small subunit ribosomal protein S6e
VGLNTGRWSEGRSRGVEMAVGQQGEFVAVVNDTDPTSGGKSYSLKISGNNHAQLLGKKIGDTVDGIFVGEGEQTLSGYKLQITGGSDKTGTPLRRDLEGGSRQAVLVTRSVGFKGHNLVFKTKGGEKKRFRYKPDGLRKRRYFRGNTVNQDTRQINLKVIDSGNKSLADILSAGSEEASE